MKYTALRGVCIGVDRHLMPGDDPVELDAGTASFLVNIGAVAPAPDQPAVEHTLGEPAETKPEPPHHAGHARHSKEK